MLVATSTASSMSSVIVTRSGSMFEIMPRSRTGPSIQSNSPRQYAESKSTIGIFATFCVCTNVSASKVSSNVPKPPGQTITPDEYFMNIVLRTKK